MDRPAIKNKLTDLVYGATSDLLSGPYRIYADVKGNSTLVCPFIATVAGIKPAMDDWIDISRLEVYLSMCRKFGLHTRVSCYFMDLSEKDIQHVEGGERLTTTFASAVGTDSPPEQGEAHVFVAREQSALDFAFANGWYNVAIDNRIVDKPVTDHPIFGRALGYPECCTTLFSQENDWRENNFYYSVYKRTSIFDPICNSFMRHTPFAYISHMPCSFDCNATRLYAKAVRDLVLQYEPHLASLVDSFLNRPVLCLSERHIYCIDGEVDLINNRVRYRECVPLPPTRRSEPLSGLIAEGDEILLSGNVIRVYLKGRLLGVYEARGDKIGPETPFLVQWAMT